MTIETWMAFCAATLAFVLLPGPLASLVARYALNKGRWTALVTVPAVSLGLGAAFAVAGLPILIVATALPGAVEPLTWLGLAYLMLYAVWSFQEPAARGRRAANDNLPEQERLATFVHLVRIPLRTARYVVALAALLVQFAAPVSGNMAVLMEMQALFLIAAAAGCLVHVIYPGWALERIRRPALPGPASHKMHTRFIARRAVTAGYRRIAA